MTIATRCPTCGSSYQLLDEQAGLRVRCRECKNVFDVPRRPERLEVVPRLPESHGPRMPDREDDEPITSPLAHPPRANRTLLWVASILGASFVLVALICGGSVWFLLPRWRAVAAVASVDPPPPPPKEEPKQKEEPKPAPPAVVKGKDPEIAWPKMPVLGPSIKDLDDALEKLRSKDQFAQLKALEYIGKQKPPADAAKKQKILDAVNALAEGDDPILKTAAGYVKVLWEFD
jgi:predicted Zn finger-like uncharacterized protein